MALVAIDAPQKCFIYSGFSRSLGARSGWYNAYFRFRRRASLAERRRIVRNLGWPPLQFRTRMFYRYSGLNVFNVFANNTPDGSCRLSSTWLRFGCALDMACRSWFAAVSSLFWRSTGDRYRESVPLDVALHLRSRLRQFLQLPRQFSGRLECGGRKSLRLAQMAPPRRLGLAGRFRYAVRSVSRGNKQ